MDNSNNRYEEAKTWYDSIFLGCGGETLLVKDGKSSDDKVESTEYTGKGNADKIHIFCKENGLEENAFFTTAFGMALQTYTVSEQAVFAVEYIETKDPCSVRLLPVLYSMEQEEKVRETVLKSQEYLTAALENGEFGFDEIRKEYGIYGSILLSFKGETSGQETSPLTATKLKVDVILNDNRILYRTAFNPSWFSQYTVNGFVRLFDKIVSELTEKKLVNEIEFVSEEDKKAILALHDTASFVIERPAYRLLQDSAKKNPGKTALIAVDRSLTYKELNEEANAVGHALVEAGLKPDTMVAVLADRDSYAYVMREGVLKSGGAFMPIDPEYPEERIRFILEDSGAKLLVTTGKVIERRKEFLDKLKTEGYTIIDAEYAVGNKILDGTTHDSVPHASTSHASATDASAADASIPLAPAPAEGSSITGYVAPCAKTDLNIEVPYDALAYVIYTSGSTGKPKGVMLTNKNLVNFSDINDKNTEAITFTKWGGVSIAMAALTFDVSVLEEFVPLSAGMTVVLATQEQILDAAKMSELIVKNHVEVITCTPSYIMNMIEIESFVPAAKELKCIDVGSEAFPATLYDKLKAINPDVYIVNAYGPTECTITCTLKEVVDSNDVTIGKPVANVKIATVDRNGRLQPLGAMGELVIMGDDVSRGYIGREDLNRRNFIRLLNLPAYRSGDLVRIREDGEVEFHGRIDNQVKLRGLRVELGEVENVIGTYKGIRSNVVVVIHGETDYLAAYFTADEKVEISSLREHASKYLTAYMVPQAFMQLDQMPMTANGKVDKKALPAIEMAAEEIIHAENEIQEKILGIAKEIIKNDRIGINTDLFMAGLSSIGCIKMCSALSEVFNVNVRVAEIFVSKTVKGIEALICSKEEEEAVSYELMEYYPLTRTQMGIYIDSELYSGTTIYNLPYIYKIDDRIDMEKLRKALQMTFLAHPYLFMTLRYVKDEVKAFRNKPENTDIEISSEKPDASALARPFDLMSGERLFRVKMFDTQDGKYLFIDMHHIVSDGSSLDIFYEDLEKVYNGENVPVEDYTGYEAALDEERALGTDRFKKAKEWYDSVFLGCGGETMPVKDGKPTEKKMAESRFAGRTSADRVRSFCRKNGITPNAFFTAAFGMALKAYTASEQAVFSTIYNGRNDPRISRSISMFVKTIPIMFTPKDEDTVTRAIQECQSFMLSSMANDLYSFADISEAYDIKADVLFAYQGEMYEAEQTTLCGYPVSFENLSLSQAMTKLGLDIILDEDKVIYIYEYEPSVYSEYTVNGFTHLVDNIAGEFLTKEKIGDISLVSTEDEESILKLHDTEAKVAERPAYRLLQDSAKKNPEKTALIAVDRSLTYRELNEEANAVGHALVDAGLKPDTMVAVLADRDSYAYVMREGVLKSGGAFMPIDPEYPEERIQFILEDSGAKLLVTTGKVINRRNEFFDKLKTEGYTIIDAEFAIGSKTHDSTTLDSTTHNSAPEAGSSITGYVRTCAKTNLNIAVPYEALAYVIYTSGSTGKPKG
ncbi:MAG: amino acid adenylation domain-containing protein, partial [Lachnospiraceae bacterium]|nr:amino acid adenylation domain-containing protein [Lachnospiraceae bacterium]